jgi:hypothetical protein
MHTQSLNLGSLGVWLLLRIFGLNFPPNDKFPNIVLLCQVEEFANLAGSLGSKTFGVSDIGDTRDIIVALLDNNDRKDRKIRSDNTTTDRLAFTFAGATGTVARMALGKEKTHTCGMEDTLLSENMTGK